MFHVSVWGWRGEGCVSGVGFIFKWGGGHPMGCIDFDGVVLKKIVGWGGGVP